MQETSAVEITSDPDGKQDLLHCEALRLFSTGRYRDTIRCLDKVIERGQSKDALVWKGLALQRLMRKDEAVCCYERALEG